MGQLLKMLLPVCGRWGIIRYIVLGILSGLCNFLFINTVTKVISLQVPGTMGAGNRKYFLLFGIIILSFIFLRRTLSLGIIRLSQTLFWDLRKRIISLVLRADYRQFLDQKPEIDAAIVSDVSILTNTSMSIIDFFTALILAVSCLVYLSTISIKLFGITLAVAAAGVCIYYVRSKKNVRNFQNARKLENKFQESFNDILGGFKELYMDPGKSRALFEKEINGVADKAYANNMTAFTGFLNNQITGQVLFYFLISTVLLFFSWLFTINTGDTVSFVFTLLYLLSSIEAVMVLLPGIARARVASAHLMGLKSMLELRDTAKPLAKDQPDQLESREFGQITVRGLEFHYGGDAGAFGVGPIDLNIGKGEVIFIYGGNGSGKTTLVHAILGLCVPSSGEIRYNGTIVGRHNYTAYRKLFAVVFSDFYLFREVLGADHIERARWDYLIQLFELGTKVSLEGTRYTTTDLSAGQRKRLALITALLEDKPVLVLDEWAADQDPHFRKKFYTEIIPLLKAGGITIIAITHDDSYYHCADKLYKMEYGKLSQENPGYVADELRNKNVLLKM